MKKSKGNMGTVDFILYATILLLVSIGVVMVFSASSYSAGFSKSTNYDSMYYLKRQGLWAVISILAMFFMVKIDYHKIKRFTPLIMVVTFILLLTVFLFPAVNGAQRWIRFPGGQTMQPSEIAKYVVVLFMAMSISNKGEKIKKFTYGVVPYLVISGIYAGLVYKEKNLSIASVIMAVTIIVLFVGGVKIKHLVMVILPVVGLGVAGTLLVGYRLKRLLSFLDPWADPRGDGYQLIQSLLALGSGGIWGAGLGQSRQKCYFIPEPHNDFIFAVIGEELGLIGCAFIILLLLIFIWRGIVIAVRAKDTYGMILATGITSVIAIQGIINIAVVTGAMPVTGVPLPFISYGGSSLLFNMLAMGILLNISRQKDSFK